MLLVTNLPLQGVHSCCDAFTTETSKSTSKKVVWENFISLQYLFNWKKEKKPQFWELAMIFNSILFIYYMQRNKALLHICQHLHATLWLRKNFAGTVTKISNHWKTKELYGMWLQSTVFSNKAYLLEINLVFPGLINVSSYFPTFNVWIYLLPYFLDTKFFYDGQIGWRQSSV